jgi:hypothetical protein
VHKGINLGEWSNTIGYKMGLFITVQGLHNAQDFFSGEFQAWMKKQHGNTFA